MAGKQPAPDVSHLVAVDNTGELKGTVRTFDIYATGLNINAPIAGLVQPAGPVGRDDISLREAVALMAQWNTDLLPVVESNKSRAVIGVITYKNIMGAYRLNLNDYDIYTRNISLKRSGIKILLHGKKLISRFSSTA